VTAPSDLKTHLHRLCGARPTAANQLHGGCASARYVCRDHAPTRRRAVLGGHVFAASRLPSSKVSPTTSWLPADAEVTLEGYLDERGYVEPEGAPTASTWATTVRSIWTRCSIAPPSPCGGDVLHHTLQHGSAFVLDQTESGVISAMRTEAQAMQILKGAVRETGGGLSAGNFPAATIRCACQCAPRIYGEARLAIAALFRRDHATQARLCV